MSEIPKLPGLTGKTEAELRELHKELFQTEPAAEFSTIPKLTAEIKRAYAAKYPDAAKTDAAPVAAAAASGSVTKVDTRTELEHTLPQATWDALSPVELKHFTATGPKPDSLPKA